MKAPARMKLGVPFFTQGHAGRVYQQIDDEMLSAFEADCRGGTVDLASIGMMVARIREAEKDRDAFEKQLAEAHAKIRSQMEDLKSLEREFRDAGWERNR